MVDTTQQEQEEQRPKGFQKKPPSLPLKVRFPEGQPRPRPRVQKVKDKKDRVMPVYVYPHEVVNVRSKEDLEHMLVQYSHPVPMMHGATSVKTKQGMRWLIEWVFPALRWFCRVYDEEVPSWLEGKGWAEGMSKPDRVKYFGSAPIKVYEWKEDPRFAGGRE